MKKLGVIILSLTCLLSVILLSVRWIYTKMYNDSIYEEFEPVRYEKWRDYVDEVPIEDIDFEAIYKHSREVYIYAGYYNKVVLEKDIHYYAEPDKKSEVVFTLKAGETYYSCLETGSYYMYDRVQTWPTYEKNWRYGHPLFTEEEYLQAQNGIFPDYFSESYNDYPFAYIHLDDLAYIQKNALRNGEYPFTIDQKVELFWRMDARLTLTSFDQLLLYKNVYISPNVLRSYIYLPEKILIAVIVLSLGGCVFIRRWQKVLARRMKVGEE